MNTPCHLAAFAPIELLNSPRPVWILKTDPRSCEFTSQLTAEETLSRLVRAQSQLISVFRVYASICMVGHRSLPPRHPYRTSSFTWLFESILITMFSMIGEQRDALRFRQVSREVCMLGQNHQLIQSTCALRNIRAHRIVAKRVD